MFLGSSKAFALLPLCIPSLLIDQKPPKIKKALWIQKACPSPNNQRHAPPQINLHVLSIMIFTLRSLVLGFESMYKRGN